jgi:hypothetical protein
MASVSATLRIGSSLFDCEAQTAQSNFTYQKILGYADYLLPA